MTEASIYVFRETWETSTDARFAGFQGSGVKISRRPATVTRTNAQETPLTPQRVGKEGK